MTKPFVAILMGSDSDLDTMQVCIDTLDKLGIGREANVLSAHRTPVACVAIGKAGAKNEAIHKQFSN